METVSGDGYGSGGGLAGFWHPALRPNADADLHQPPVPMAEQPKTIHLATSAEDEGAAGLEEMQDDNRYEEGVPLLQEETEEEPEKTSHQRKPSLNPFADDPAEDDFFSSMTAQKIPNGDHAPERKSTVDVVQSLGFVAEEPASPEASFFDEPTKEASFFDESAEDTAFFSKPNADVAFFNEPAAEDTFFNDPAGEAAFFNESEPKVFDDAPKAEPVLEAEDPADIWGNDDDDELLEDTTATNAFSFDDDDDFLEEPAAPKTLLDTPTALTQGTPQSNSKYAPSAGIATLSAQVPSQYGATQNAWAAEKPALQGSESFADKNKGGYASPYDLPMDFGPKPKKRSSMQQLSSFGATSVPARSTSMYASQPPGQHAPSRTPQRLPPRNITPSNAAFFEDLPVTAPKRRTPTPSAQGFAPQPPLAQAPPANVPPPNAAYAMSSSVPPPNAAYTPVGGAPRPTSAYAPVAAIPSNLAYAPAIPPPEAAVHTPNHALINNAYAPNIDSTTSSAYDAIGAQLQAPTPIDPYGDVPPPPPNQSSRYSPAPGAQILQASAQKEHFGNGVASQPLLPHQPRNSSPLAYSRTAPPAENSHAPANYAPPIPRADNEQRSVSYSPSKYAPAAGVARSVSHQLGGTVSPPNGAAPPPQFQAVHPNGAIPPPRRSQTQSPGSIPSSKPQSVSSQSHHRILSDGVSKTSDSHIQYVMPTDGTELDPLQRWKGRPIFSWGFGGACVTVFPARVQRFTSQAQPMIKCGPGEIKVSSIKNILPLEETQAKFPGPLRSKGQKKDLVAWLRQRIQAIEQQNSAASYEDLSKNEERATLWKTILLLVEKDGVLENAAQEMREILAVQAAQGFVSSQIQKPPVQYDVRDLDSLRSHLLVGDRERAVWDAVDKRLWAHAMLISSTMNRDLWKRVVQEFVRNEIRPLGENSGSISALYEIFAGNWEDSIDQLVPPSARAGLTMVDQSKNVASGRSNLDGLESWRDTLSLVLSNRSTEDQNGIMALGNLLASFGRTDAAHICYLFGRPLTVFSGYDDPRATFSLLGRSQQPRPYDTADILDHILLSEIYDFALTLDPSQKNSVPAPHLQGYKLLHAQMLAEYGLPNEAQTYCDAVSAALKASKGSPYYHRALFAEYDNLAKRLQLGPKDNSSSWKPSMEKVSGSMWAKFNSFVSGEDETAAAQGPNPDEVGPFSKVQGGTPTISRSQSRADMYGAYGSEPSVSGSRYEPRSSIDSYRPVQYEPRTSLDRSSLEVAQPFRSSGSPYEPQQYSTPVSQPYEPHPPQPSYEDQTPTQDQPNGYSPYGGTPEYGSSYEPPSYQPNEPAPVEEEKPALKKKSFMDDDDDDDLLRRAAALARDKKPTPTSDRGVDPAVAAAAAADAARDAAASRKGWFSGWFSGTPKNEMSPSPAQGSGPIKAKLGEDKMSLYYDKELKRWVNPNASASESAPKSTPPPPKGPPSRAASVAGTPRTGTPISTPPPMGTPSNLSTTRPPPAPTPLSQSMSMSASLATGTDTTPPPPAESGTPPVSGDSPAPHQALLNLTSGPSSGPPSRPPSRPATAMSNASSAADDFLASAGPRKGGTVGRKGKAKRGYIDVMAKQ